MSTRQQLPSFSLLQPRLILDQFVVPHASTLPLHCHSCCSPRPVCVPCLQLEIPSTCSNPQKLGGWSWQVPTWMAAVTYIICLNSSRSKGENSVSSSFWMGESACFATCSQGLHSLLHTAAFRVTSLYVCKRSNPMLSGT